MRSNFKDAAQRTGLAPKSNQVFALSAINASWRTLGCSCASAAWLAMGLCQPHDPANAGSPVDHWYELPPPLHPPRPSLVGRSLEEISRTPKRKYGSKGKKKNHNHYKSRQEEERKAKKKVKKASAVYAGPMVMTLAVREVKIFSLSIHGSLTWWVRLGSKIGRLPPANPLGPDLGRSHMEHPGKPFEPLGHAIVLVISKYGISSMGKFNSNANIIKQSCGKGLSWVVFFSVICISSRSFDRSFNNSLSETGDNFNTVSRI
ncbi:hypothetical protein BX600DRAFT_494806 [Xylariales sp. PMI_506]|nr:hypothetical protein BX600DRAFT_494806 [Xylariales sp. PMI_506]